MPPLRAETAAARMATDQNRFEPLYDTHPLTGAAIEVFYADYTLETFGRCGPGWFWWYRRRGAAPIRPRTGPFPTRYAAYRDAMTTGSRCSATTRGAQLAACAKRIKPANTKRNELHAINGHTRRFWNLSGTF
jgi:hypothetical protein